MSTTSCSDPGEQQAHTPPISNSSTSSSASSHSTKLNSNMDKIDNDQLIAVVNDSPYLYDTSHAEYKDTVIKAAAWERIAKQFDVAAIECQTRWKNLRDRYTRERQRMSRGMITYSKWRLFPKLDFLFPFLHQRSRSEFGSQMNNSAVSMVSVNSCSRSPSVGDTDEMVHDEQLPPDMKPLPLTTVIKTDHTSPKTQGHKRQAPKDYSLNTNGTHINNQQPVIKKPKAINATGHDIQSVLALAALSQSAPFTQSSAAQLNLKSTNMNMNALSFPTSLSTAMPPTNASLNYSNPTQPSLSNTNPINNNNNINNNNSIVTQSSTAASLMDAQQMFLQQQDDEDIHFALSVAYQLKKLGNQQRALARLKIQQVLYEVQYGVNNQANATTTAPASVSMPNALTGLSTNNMSTQNILAGLSGLGHRDRQLKDALALAASQAASIMSQGPCALNLAPNMNLAQNLIQKTP